MIELPIPLLAGIGTAIGALIGIIIAIGKLAAKLAKIDRLERELIAIGKLAAKLGNVDRLEREFKEHKSEYSDNRYDINARIARTNGKVSAMLNVFGPRLPQPTPPIDDSLTHTGRLP